MGNIQEISLSSNRNNGKTIVPLSKEEFVVVSTGEVKKVQHHALDRTENLRNLEKSMRSLSDLINSNITFDNAEQCRFITFTYKENMRDSKKLYMILKTLINALRGFYLKRVTNMSTL